MSCEHYLIPIPPSKANDLVRQLHRHHEPTHNIMHAVGLSCYNRIIGAAIIGRSVSIMLDDGWTAEVVRCVVKDGHPTACSMLYGACWRAAKALGYRKLITYTLSSETGTSLRAVGWIPTPTTGGSWSRPLRTRIDKFPTEPKTRWEISRGQPPYDYEQLSINTNDNEDGDFF